MTEPYVLGVDAGGTRPYVLGVDAGGTRTRCIVAALDGTILGRAEGEAANLAANREGAIRSLRETAAEALRLSGVAGPARAACAGVAGYSSLGEGHAEAIFASVAEADHWTVRPDLHIALTGGTAGHPGIVVIGGTGSVAFGRNAAGREHRCGGWGYLLGDEGSAFWMGRQGLVAALHAMDGRGPETVLTGRMAEAVGGAGPRAIVRYAYAEGRSSSEFARLAPIVSHAADEGDAVSREILAEAGRHLAAIGATTISLLGMEQDAFPVVMVGGAYRAGEVLIETFRAGITAAATNATVGPPRYVPVAGALILALRAAGAPPEESALARFDAALVADLA